MSIAQPPFIADLERVAGEAQAEEVRFRKSFALEVEKRERARAFAFRRLGLMRIMAAAAAGADTVETARAAQRDALKAALGWYGDSELRTTALEAWGAVADAVWAARTEAPDPDAPSPADALASFEAWYEVANGSPFLALLDQEPLEAPVVEF